MKSLLILILLAVLGGGAWLSKPSEAGFKEMILKSAGASDKKDLADYILHGFKGKSEQFLDNCKFHDRIFWVSVECNGKTVYTGAFNTWFGSDLSVQKASN